METMKGQNQSKIAPKRIKFQEIAEGGVDRISALADCLLVEILSRLDSTKEAIKTGTLSTRWKHLWTSVPTLIFTNTDRTGLLFDFFSFVDETLTQRRPLKLKKFELVTWYDTPQELQINNWIRYAISCNVEELNLELVYLYMGFLACFRLDQLIFISSCFTDLRLGGCIFNPTGAISWKNLRRLYISNGNLDEDLIENILTGSPVLETLVLDYCLGYSVLDITSKSVEKLVVHGYEDKAKDFVEANSYYDGPDTIEINAPNILSLTIQGALVLWRLSLLNVSSLVEANLNYKHNGCWVTTPDYAEEETPEEAEEEMLKGFIENVRHVKELKIGVNCSEVLPRLQAKGFIFPPNVKFPDVTHD